MWHHTERQKGDTPLAVWGLQMNVLFLGPMRIPIPSEKGAVEDIIWQLAKRLHPDEKVWIFNPLHLRANKIESCLSTASLLSWGRNKQLVVHSHNPYASMALLSPLAKPKSHIMTLHYPPWVSDRAVENSAFLRILSTLNLFGVKLTAPNLIIVNWLQNRGMSCEYLPNGVDTHTFRPARRDEQLRKCLLGNNADLLLVSVGRMDPTKNQLALLEAFRVLLESNFRIKLVLIGPKSGTFQGSSPNDYATRIKSFIEANNLASHIEWLGEVGSKLEVAKILASCDLYVHPSKVEAAPLVTLEAMASGLPIVAFDLPWYRGYLENGVNAILCHNTQESLNEGIKYALSSGLSETARKRQQEYARKFSWDRLIADYKKLYAAE